MEFIGRTKELEALQTLYSSKKPELFIVYGRRRLGKTTLLKHSLKNVKNSIYFLLTKESPLKNLEDFQNILSEELNLPIIKEIKTESWKDFFRNILEFIPNDYIFVFDEIPYLFSQDSSMQSQFQKIYDEYLQSKSCKLILCGSSFSIMDEISSYSSPLYGRRTGKIHLGPFTLKETQKFLKGVTLEEVFKYHLIFGGVPYYLNQIQNQKSYEENIHHLFFSISTIFDDEAQFLLKEEVREIRNYLSIIRAISQGKNTYSQINNSLDIGNSSLSAYLISLENLNIIEQSRSLFDKINSKKTRYVIKDNFLYIWFSVFEIFKRRIISEQMKKKVIRVFLMNKLGYLFERECCRILSRHYESIGNYFNKEGVEIDIIAKNNNSYDLFECKFKSGVNIEKEILKLKEKSSYLPKNVLVHNYYCISIDKGFTLKDLLIKS